MDPRVVESTVGVGLEKGPLLRQGVSHRDKGGPQGEGAIRKKGVPTDGQGGPPDTRGPQ